MPVQCSQMSEAFFPPRPGCPLCYPGSLLHHNPASLSSPDATSATLHFECYNHKFPQKPFCWSDKQHLSWLSCCATEICSPYSQSINHRGFLQSFRGVQHRLHRHPQSVQRGEQKVFACQISVSLCSSSLSPFLILIWKCPIAFI